MAGLDRFGRARRRGTILINYNLDMSDITQILSAIRDGDPNAAGQLLPLDYEELRRIARAHMANERVNHTLQATALVHEAYLRLILSTNPGWDGRGHFFVAAAEAMRRILVEYARAKNAKKRGGTQERFELDDLPPIVTPCRSADELLALDEALDRLAEEDPAKAQLIQLLYFAGLNLEEAAAVQGIARTTAYRHWQFARAWLRVAVDGRAEPTDAPFPVGQRACPPGRSGEDIGNTPRLA